MTKSHLQLAEDSKDEEEELDEVGAELFVTNEKNWDTLCVTVKI